MMKNYLLTLCFDGNAFHGSQKQNNADTIQQTVETALATILRKPHTIYCCSRTDAGVHANMFCCNFFTDAEFENKRLLRGMNAVLPKEIAVFDCSEVEESFHARKSAIKKEYIYKIWNAPQRNPFASDYSLHFHRPLDEKMLNEQAKDYIGEHNFSAFCSAGATVSTFERTIYDAEVTRQGDYVVFKVVGNGFLYNMVRIMVGTLLDISDGKIPAGSIPDIIKSKDREKAGITAPACGLYLNKVYYTE